MLSQRQHVLRAFSQRWKLDLHHMDPIVKVLPKGLLLHHRRQILIRGGNHPHLGPQGLIAAQSLKLPVLQNPQKLCLQGQRHIPDFVQKDGSPIRPLKLSDPLRQCPCKGTPLMSKQFALQQGIRNGRTVNRHIRASCQRAVGIDRPGHQLLTSPAFAHQ